ncbi:MAG: HAD-IIB family hydrolase [Sandaracinaceae bacterium]|nr:HAD-IIB family hydrolase [Sandaracinaceae bacterium]
MRPLEEADLGAVDGVAFDVDDTLTTHGALTVPAYAALAELKGAGFRLIAVTGRPLGWADAMAATWPIDAAVGENGAGWTWRDGRTLRTGYADDPVTRAEQRDVLEAIRRDVHHHLPELREASDQPARRCDLAFDIGEGDQVPEPTVRALVERIRSHGAAVTVSSVHAHAIPGSWDKARGVRGAVRDALGEPLDRDRWLFVGDSGNDEAGFAFFEHTVGVANVRDHLERLSTPPAWVTQAERGEGFAELAAALLRARS